MGSLVVGTYLPRSPTAFRTLAARACIDTIGLVITINLVLFRRKAIPYTSSTIARTKSSPLLGAPMRTRATYKENA
ncbi:hypothetical protein SCLCIDRAFT_319340 [Scleroderma citrinum Foug A]|uniref:Uncharacterized protein n=1 Tax=Scleroderma citrinum Foug A TaxID=1036808 RepID=A0A0C2ZY80_9AGAM|nr:hypothetical protein SCLCIDRAFT_319340 [Scleroderma citrinum Foug A]